MINFSSIRCLIARSFALFDQCWFIVIDKLFRLNHQWAVRHLKQLTCVSKPFCSCLISLCPIFLAIDFYLYFILWGMPFNKLPWLHSWAGQPVHMHMYMYVCMFTYPHIYTHTCTQAYMFECINRWINAIFTYVSKIMKKYPLEIFFICLVKGYFKWDTFWNYCRENSEV